MFYSITERRHAFDGNNVALSGAVELLKSNLPSEISMWRGEAK